jgi:hypothetical protein
MFEMGFHSAPSNDSPPWGRLANERPGAILAAAEPTATPRQLQLVCAAVCRRLSIVDKQLPPVVCALEQTIDDESLHWQLLGALDELGPALIVERYSKCLRHLLATAVERGSPDGELLHEAACVAAAWRTTEESGSDFVTQLQREEKIQTLIVEDVMAGAPDDLEIDHHWWSPNIGALAAGIYSRSDFDQMPVLYDALYEVGCPAPSIMDHCRRPFHARGCWVVESLRSELDRVSPCRGCGARAETPSSTPVCNGE